MGGAGASVRAGFAVAQEDAVAQEPAVLWPGSEAVPSAAPEALAPAGNTTGSLFAGSRIPMGERPATARRVLGCIVSCRAGVGFRSFGGI